jgi:Protein of unknown function with HXXEE motif
MRVDPAEHWQNVGAVALLPVSALAVRRGELRPLAALLWHQTEEWVWPGGFLPWMNREILGSDEDEFPLDRRLGFIINVVFGWGFSIAPMIGPRAAAPSALLYVSHLGNLGLHGSWAVRHRRWDPGTVTAVATLTPVAIIGLRDLVRDERVSRTALGTGVAAGVAFSAALPVLLKRRLRRRRTGGP